MDYIIEIDMEMLEYHKWVFHNAVKVLELLTNENWKKTTLDEQHSIIYGYWVSHV